MSDEYYKPSKAELLANLVTGNGSMSQAGAAVQRSHRFPLHIFIQIENMAKMAGVPVSVCINELLDCGLEAVRKKLPEEALGQLNYVEKGQFERPTKSIKVEIKGRNLSTSKTGKARSKKS